MKKLYLIIIVCVLVATSACSTKYAVTFDSSPQGALLVCNGKNLGYTPKTLYYDEKIKERSTISLRSCSANWISGANKIYGAFSPAQYPDGVRSTVQRPSVAGYSQDADFALKVKEMRQKQRKARDAALAESIRQFSQSAKNQRKSLEQQTYSYDQPTPNTYNSSSSKGTPIYDSSECIGAVVSGECAGSINPNPSNVLRKKCYGEIINGECQGAVGY